MGHDLKYLPRLRGKGFVIQPTDDGDLNIGLPKGVEMTPVMHTWLVEQKPALAAELQAERLAELSAVYRYERHSTRADEHGKGHLDISFVNIETGEVIEIFFNVHLIYRRGELKGSYFKTGPKGRFWVRTGSKFAIFWTATFGGGANWSRVWRQMNRLKPLRFTGEVKDAETQGGKRYRHFTELNRVKL